MQDYFFRASLISVNNFSVEVGSTGGAGAVSSFFLKAFNAFIKENNTSAISVNLMMEERKLPYFTAPQLRLAMSCTLAAFSAGASSRGVTISSTKEDTIDPKAPPIITATAKSTMLPFNANDLNSFKKLIFINFEVKYTMEE